jgi:acetyl esterase/lipase
MSERETVFEVIENRTRVKKLIGKKVIKVWGIILLVLAILLAGGFFYVKSHPQIIVGMIQKLIYKDVTQINSFEPKNEPGREVKADGSLYLNDIEYAKVYPNSFLDITYPSEEITVNRPTVIYFHGGGYFAGDKISGDPLAVDGTDNIFSEMISRGYNLVNINYALVPDYHFPVPLIQMNQAINFLVEHAEEFHLNMESVVIFGQSAGAILTAQYGSLISNKDYQSELGIIPVLSTHEIKALVVDDAPLVFEYFNFKTSMLIFNYLGTNDSKGKLAKTYNPIPYMTEDYPPTFITAANNDGFPKDMQEYADILEELGVANEYYYVEKSEEKLSHGYLSYIHSNKYARECFDKLLNFIDAHTR